MFDFSIWHLLILLIVVALVFGTGKLPKVAGDLALGIKNFKQAMREGAEMTEPKRSASETRAQAEAPRITPQGEDSVKVASAEEALSHK